MSQRSVASSWVVVLAVALAGAAPVSAEDGWALPPALMTEFDPRRDGLPFANVGDLARPRGNCWGMSLLAIDNYLRRLDRGREGERALPHDQLTALPREADPTQQATVGLLQETVTQLDFSDVPVESGRRLPLSDPSPVLEALERIGHTGVPEVLVIRGEQGAHAVVLYGYRDGQIRVYDPNFPGESLAWPFDPVSGLGRHPKADRYAFYAGLTHASTTPYEAHRTSDAMDRLREACASQDATCTGRYPTISAQLERTPEGDVVVAGQVAAPADGGQRPQRVWLAVNGQPIGSAEVSRFGTFRAVVPPGALAPGGDNLVRVIGETSTNGHAQFAGFADLPLPTPTAETVLTSPRPRARPTREGSPRPKARPEGLGQSRGLGAAVAATHE
jgi:hypothetical protein